ncbi:MAG: hypothetical protein ASARMPRED_004760 [Alectoria sarmentosa]|nr:MAG: hypothetical protein ASARMPRED_004760 [Alectoria sarmentosa]
MGRNGHLIARHALRTHARRIVHVHIQQAAPAAKLLPVARTRHVATARAVGRLRGRARQIRRAVAFLAVLDPGDLHRRRRHRRLAEGDAGLDRHARRVRVRGTGEEAPVGHLVVAALGDVVADLRDRLRRLVGRQVVQTQEIRVAADLAAVARARFAAAGLAHGGGVLETGAAVALLAVFEAGEGEVVAVGGAVALAGFDGHAGCVGDQPLEESSPTVEVWIEGTVEEGVVEMVEEGVEDLGEEVVEALVEDIVVKDGVVEDGVVEDDVVKDGVVENDVVENGVVKNDVVKDGVVEDGVVKDDVVKDSVVEDDVVEDGVVKDGVVKNDVVKDGVMEDGVVENSVVEDGVMKDGLLEDGALEEDMIDDIKVVNDEAVEDMLLEAVVDPGADDENDTCDDETTEVEEAMVDALLDETTEEAAEEMLLEDVVDPGTDEEPTEAEEATDDALRDEITLKDKVVGIWLVGDPLLDNSSVVVETAVAEEA